MDKCGKQTSGIVSPYRCSSAENAQKNETGPLSASSGATCGGDNRKNNRQSLPACAFAASRIRLRLRRIRLLRKRSRR